MNAKLRQQLDIIEDMLLETAPTNGYSPLWRVLTALRGPDFDDWDGDAKGLTTRIRALAFPRMAALMKEDEGYVHGAAFSREPWPKTLPDLPYHFLSHIKAAKQDLS